MLEVVFTWFVMIFQLELDALFNFSKLFNLFMRDNTNDGGSWKITKPTPEISECSRLTYDTGSHFTNFCRLLRKWKNKNGFVFKVLLIDTMVSKYLEDEGVTSIS